MRDLEGYRVGSLINAVRSKSVIFQMTDFLNESKVKCNEQGLIVAHSMFERQLANDPDQ